MSNNHVDRLLQRKQAELSVDQKHLESFTDLVAKNRLLHERAEMIIDLGGNDRLSPPIVLKASPEEGDTGIVIGFASMLTVLHEGTNVNRLTLAMYSTSTDQLEAIKLKFDELEVSLLSTNYQASQAMHYMMGRDPDTTVFAPNLGVSTEDEELDEINTAVRATAAKGIRFSRLINLRGKKKNFSKSVANVESNLELFEKAINSTELNPDYANWIENYFKAVSELPETLE